MEIILYAMGRVQETRIRMRNDPDQIGSSFCCVLECFLVDWFPFVPLSGFAFSVRFLLKSVCFPVYDSVFGLPERRHAHRVGQAGNPSI